MAQLSIRAVDSLDLPELQPYRTMRYQMEHRRQGLFVAEGEKVVRRLLESRFGVVSLLIPPKWLEPLRPLVEQRPEAAIQVFTAEKEILEPLVGFALFQGVMALGRVPETLSLETLLARAPRPILLAAVDGLSNPENIGVVVRNAAALGAHGLIVGQTSSSPFLRRAVRSSMGAVFQLPIVELENLAVAIGQLRAAGVRCVAAHPHTDRRRLWECDLSADCCLVFGSEGLGITPEVLAACDEAVAIPMAAGVDSLNVSSAAAALLYEAARQRWGATKNG